jgi:hypothetical protein
MVENKRSMQIINAVLACTLWAGTAHAEPNQCALAYEEAQVMRAEGQLRAARRQLQDCVRPECSEFVRADCGRWLGELEAALPSIVLVVKRGATELENVEVVFDDQPLVSRIDGKAIPVDPGRHVLRFSHQGTDPLTIEVLLREGDKNRLITAILPEPKGTAPARDAVNPHRPVQTARRHGTLTYVLAGVGALGTAGFVTLSLLGNGDRRDLERTCAPRCSEDEIGTVRTKYLLADASLAIGALALGGAAYLFFSSPAPARAATTHHLQVSMAVTPQLAFGTARLSF